MGASYGTNLRDSTLENLFKACEKQGENSLVWEFFLGSGFREQEVEYFSPKDTDYKGGVVIARKKKSANADEEGRPINSRKRNRDEFKVKDREARAVPIPSGLMAKLMERQRQSTSKWVFPAPCGKPEGHFLRKLKMIAFKGGLNCGNCVNSNGLSCKTHPVCDYWSLHKFRRTFATSHHERGVPVRKLQKWLGHESLEVTLKYLAISDRRSAETRGLVNNTFDWLYPDVQGTSSAGQTTVAVPPPTPEKSGACTTHCPPAATN